MYGYILFELDWVCPNQFRFKWVWFTNLDTKVGNNIKETKKNI